MRYEFRVDGVMSDEARAVFADMQITELPRQTLIDGEVLDESHLRGVIAQLAALGLNLISALPDPDRELRGRSGLGALRAPSSACLIPSR